MALWEQNGPRPAPKAVVSYRRTARSAASDLWHAGTNILRSRSPVSLQSLADPRAALQYRLNTAPRLTFICNCTGAHFQRNRLRPLAECSGAARTTSGASPVAHRASPLADGSYSRGRPVFAGKRMSGNATLQSHRLPIARRGRRSSAPGR